MTPWIGVPLGGFGEGKRLAFNGNPIARVLGGLSCGLKSPAQYNHFLVPSVGIHDPILVKVLCLDNGAERVVILRADLVATSGKEFEAIYQRVSHLVKRENLFVTATHTHSGPATVADKKLWQFAAMDCFDQRVFDFMVDRAAEAIIAATQSLQPARIGFGATLETRVTKNRRHRPGHVDPEVSLIKVERADGSPLSVLVNFAIHGISVWHDNQLFSADNMGYLERRIEACLPGATALFLNGAEGDVNPEFGHTDFASAEKVGEMLADTVLAEVPHIQTTDRAEIRAARVDERFGGARIYQGCQYQGVFDFCSWLPAGATLQLDESWAAHDLPFSALRINDRVMGFCPGEPLTDLGLEIKADGRALGYGHTMVVGLANEHMGYIAPPFEYDRGGYEVIATLFGRDTGVRVRKNVREAMARVRR